MVDFLVTDAFDRSGGAIAFPAATMAGSAFRVHVYGDRPGRFYDAADVRLWMPPDLLRTENGQIDYLAGYGDGKLYLAFWNQSFQEQAVEVNLNPQRVTLAAASTARAWSQNEDIKEIKSVNNRISFRVPAKGIHAFAIDRAAINSGLQAKMRDPAAVRLGPESLRSIQTPFGAVHAMILTMGRGLTNAFVYTEALPEDVIAARLKYRQKNGTWKYTEDAIFPFEFSVWLDEEAGDFECVFEIETTDQRRMQSETIRLAL
jgi:hypothetical protein